MSATIPPAFDLAFQKLANDVCDRAAVDREDRVRLAYELQTHLQELWREGESQGLSKELALERAVELFGSVESVARSLNGHDLRALLLHESARPTRVNIIALYFFMLFFNRSMIESFSVNAETANRISIPDNFNRLLLTLAGFYFVCHFGEYWSDVRAIFRDWFRVKVLDVEMTEKEKSSINQPLTVFKWLVLLAGAYVSYDALMLFFYPFHAIKILWTNHLWTKADFTLHDIALMVVLTLLIPLGIFAFLSASSEIFDWPRQKRERKKIVTWCFYTLPFHLYNRLLPRLTGI